MSAILLLPIVPSNEVIVFSKFINSAFKSLNSCKGTTGATAAIDPYRFSKAVLAATMPVKLFNISFKSEIPL